MGRSIPNRGHRRNPSLEAGCKGEGVPNILYIKRGGGIKNGYRLHLPQ